MPEPGQRKHEKSIDYLVVPENKEDSKNDEGMLKGHRSQLEGSLLWPKLRQSEQQSK